MNNGVKLREKIHYILMDVHKLNISIDQSYIKNNISSYSERDISFINNVCMNTMRYVFHCNKIVNLYTK